jgi:molybdenum cofactor cytidylyltransferase
MKEHLFSRTSCVILSAGSSTRMGEHKALLKFGEDSTFIQHITNTYALSGFDQIIVVANIELAEQMRERGIHLPESALIVINDKPESGRFYSLQTGMRKLKEGNDCFFQNVDNPFISSELLTTLILEKEKADVIIPAYKQKAGHPVLFNARMKKLILDIDDPETRIDVFLKGFRIKYIESPDSCILTNINSREDYLTAGFIL